MDVRKSRNKRKSTAGDHGALSHVRFVLLLNKFLICVNGKTIFADPFPPLIIPRFLTECKSRRNGLTFGAIRRHVQKGDTSRRVMKTPPDFSAGGISQEFLIEHILIIDDTNIISCWSDFINPVVNQFVEFTAFIVLFE